MTRPDIASKADAVQSMTGFGNAEGSHLGQSITCEMRSVNGKALDCRLRLPPGFDTLDAPIRKIVAAHIGRGNIQINVQLVGSEDTTRMGIDEAAFAKIATEAKQLAIAHGLTAPTTDGILAVRGVVAADEPTAKVDLLTADMTQAVLDVVDTAAQQLAVMRRVEGAALQAVLGSQLDQMDRLTTEAESDASYSPEVQGQRMREQLAKLLSADESGVLDPQRLHMEAALLATKADISEETDRLSAHIYAARALLQTGGTIGRKLDFLSQEFNRETNTICSKSASAALTAIGLALKAVVDQFREQVQNVQ